MTEVERLQDQLSRSWNGDAWHGPSLADVLAGVDAEAAVARPIPDARTIRELVLHITAWQDRVRRRLEGDAAPMSDAESWPAEGRPEEVSWREALDRLEAARRALHATVAGLDPGGLDEPAAGGPHAAYVLIHGVIQHDLYHGGQIALLAKAARAGASGG